VGALGPGIEIVAGEGNRHARCARCHAHLATAPAPWKSGAALIERPLEPPGGDGGATDGRALRPPAVIAREFFCPGCATALDVEVVVAGAPIEAEAMPITYDERAGGG
jgi:acetone carboxylase gamma subunit